MEKQLYTLGGVCGPLLVTFIKEATGGYTAVFYTFLGMITVAFLLSVWLKRDVALMRRVMEGKAEESMKPDVIPTSR